jgi:hypothetical protein
MSIPVFPQVEQPVLVLSPKCLAVLFGLLALWALPFLADPRHPSGLARDLFHLLNLPFVLGGKVLLAQFGSFGLALLSPALGGLLAPLLVIGFSLAKGGRLGALAGLWWLGAALMDAANDLEDLPSRVRALVEGCGGLYPSRNWEFHLPGHGHALARNAGTLGSMLVIVALALAGALLWRQGAWNRSV